MSKKKNLTPADYDRWETPPGAIFSIDQDEPEEPKKSVAKSYDEIRKFNPFHDSLGRFSSAQGFKSYSANPKTKAGAMAIQRSNAAGHGRTMNVHRESKGESITQNANWLATGKKPAVPAAVSRARYQQRKQKQQQAAQQAQNNPQNQATQTKTRSNYQQKKFQQAQAAVQRQQQSQQAQRQQAQQAKNTKHTMAQGKDISSSFSVDTTSKKRAFDQVAEKQGFDKKPQVMKKADFDAAVKASGFVAYRTWNPGVDGMSGKQMSAKDFKNQFMKSDSLQAAGNGGRVYGGGIYVAATKSPKPGASPSASATSAAMRNSQIYGGSRRATASITLDPSAKVANYSSINRKFYALPRQTQDRFSGDIGAYAASLGFDAMRIPRGSCDYVTIFNRTKAIVLDD